MKGLPMIAGWLLVLGGINIGLEGLLDYELFDSILGADMLLERALDLLVGASALYMAYNMLMVKKSKK